MTPLGRALADTADTAESALDAALEQPVDLLLTHRRRCRTALRGAAAGGVVATAGVLLLTGSTLADWHDGDAVTSGAATIDGTPAAP